MSDLTTLSDDELMQQWTDAGDAVTAAQEINREFAEEFKRRNTERAVTEKLEGMTDAEREAMSRLSQSFEPAGIESEETVAESPDPAPVNEGVTDNG